MGPSRWTRDEGSVSIVQAALIMPLLAMALGGVLHLGLYLLSRQVVITAVQEGLTVATAADGTTSQGETTTQLLIDDHSAVDILSLSSSTTATTVTMTATVQTPGLVPGLTRLVTVTQTAAKEQWIVP